MKKLQKLSGVVVLGLMLVMAVMLVSQASQPGIMAAQEPVTPTAEENAEQQVHIVQPGDNLSAIASAYGVTLQALLAANPQITNPDIIFVGQSINIPGGGSSLTPEREDSFALPGPEIILGGGVALVYEGENGPDTLIYEGIDQVLGYDSFDTFVDAVLGDGVDGLDGLERVQLALIEQEEGHQLFFSEEDAGTAELVAATSAWYEYTVLAEMGVVSGPAARVPGSVMMAQGEVFRVTSQLEFEGNEAELADSLLNLDDVDGGADSTAYRRLLLVDEFEQYTLILFDAEFTSPAPGDWIRSWCLASRQRAQSWWCIRALRRR